MAHFGEVLERVDTTKDHESIILGGGCFWCVEAVFAELRGVKRIVNGYAGGTKLDANYADVCTGATDHAEVVLVEFDPRVITTREVLEVFFATHDPTTPGRQGNDRGPQYRSAVFYTTDEQRRLALDVMENTVPGLYGARAITELAPHTTFYAAEAGHQNYYRKVGERNPYCSFVIAPKVGKFRKEFTHLRK
ncbi:peptide-methionine (S)-S-oxide reductase MsrA [Neolewinella antarctica]|uniref:Peptide methionine sulfoxide reductase MsrA n=1 Tax=Neolewinella antarctica TaxID=442734 RepID=A0ABX0X6D9_9BACT|nr:peptide-methionine (S)-S-oxide reductase MsrA [Neolewinella antarctica]NJC24780.1 peptide-methionine (S)-S-oxide reductase [Neolewinella antarctica]